IPKTYDPKEAESHHYARWEADGYFAPEINKDPAAQCFTIVIPPPNVTGSLHMGHALQHTMMDVLTRWKRMLGFRTLWLPGMDPDLSRAVNEEFVRLYDDGLIYRGNRIVNWCPNDQTVLSDLEVQRDPKKGKLYYLRYPFKNRTGAITVATTRPETMLGDTAVAVSPADER